MTAFQGSKAASRSFVDGKGKSLKLHVDGNAKVLGAAYRIPEVQVSGVNGSTDIHITQDEIALTGSRRACPRAAAWTENCGS